jgi:cellulose synthase/poly-beta-1,6-N-acetylglucosamine synthase-like glycosyltransferase
MTNIEKYIARQTFLPPVFKNTLAEDVGLVITIPAYAEEDLLVSLQSLKSCDLPSVGVEVVVIINHPIQAEEFLKEANKRISEKAQQWAIENSVDGLQFLVSIPIELPKKHAGAGLARKIAMDEAVVRLQKSVYGNPIIACFDADATCSENYLITCVKHFKENPKSLACSVNFEHPISTQSTFLNEGIIQYELHLRYYQAALVFARHPQAEFTVGSSMAVTRNAYVAQGGMNRRKAGEDFWFMLKLMMAGEISAITSATVYPSARESFRVPFGTGRAMSEMTEKEDNTYFTAPFESFKRLKVFLSQVDDLYEKEVEIADELTFRFLESVNWTETIAEIKDYTTDKGSFIKRFYRWFNLFMVMKYFHFLRDHGVPDVPVVQQSKQVLYLLGLENEGENSVAILKKFRAKKRVQSNDYTLS